MDNFTPAQYDRFEAYRRHALPKQAVRKVCCLIALLGVWNATVIGGLTGYTTDGGTAGIPACFPDRSGVFQGVYWGNH